MYFNDLFFVDSLFFFFGYYIKVVFEVLFVVGGFIEMGDEGFQVQQDFNQIVEIGFFFYRDYYV